MMRSTRHALFALLIFTVAFGVAACADDAGTGPVGDEAYVDHDEPSDFLLPEGGKADGVSTRFDRERIMEDAFYTDVSAIDEAGIQAMLERSPYGNRSWLADHVVGGRSVARILMDVAETHDINPIVILARMQVEAGLVSKTVPPSQYRIDRALGCGCFDGQACIGEYLGLDKQLECGARVMRQRFDDSVAGEGIWQAGEAKRTLDRIWVRPQNHATAALYTYTPWVLEGRGGNWLVWTITQRYERHAIEHGLTGAFQSPWVGSSCTSDAECGFVADGATGQCMPYTFDNQTLGVCTLPCEGYCPDKAGHAETFCVRAPAEFDNGGGICAAKAQPENDLCRQTTGTRRVWLDRYIGSSSAGAKTAEVCLP